MEFLQALLARIAVTEPTYHAYIAVTEDLALAQAQAAEAEIMRGGWRGPMHGVPYAAKDIFDIAGMATLRQASHRPSRHADAAIVGLREADAVLLGKLACLEFATGGPTNCVADRPQPVEDLDLHPGGSSSSSASRSMISTAQAALNTDTGGLGAQSATCCGVIDEANLRAVNRAGVFARLFARPCRTPTHRRGQRLPPPGRSPAMTRPILPTRAASQFRRSARPASKPAHRRLHAFYAEDMIAAPEQSAPRIAVAADVLRRLGAPK